MAELPAAALRTFGEEIARLADEAVAIDPAIGVRLVARQAALALVEQLEHSDPHAPVFHRYEAPWSQWGAPNPDDVYVRAEIDPGATYVVRGDVRGVREILVSLMEGDMPLDEYGVFAERALHDHITASPRHREEAHGANPGDFVRISAPPGHSAQQVASSAARGHRAPSAAAI